MSNTNNNPQNNNNANNDGHNDRLTIDGQTFASREAFARWHKNTAAFAAASDPSSVTTEVAAIASPRSVTIVEGLGMKDLAIGAGVVAGIAGLAYGGYKLYEHYNDRDFFDGMVQGAADGFSNGSSAGMTF